MLSLCEYASIGAVAAAKGQNLDRKVPERQTAQTSMQRIPQTCHALPAPVRPLNLCVGGSSVPDADATESSTHAPLAKICTSLPEPDSGELGTNCHCMSPVWPLTPTTVDPRGLKYRTTMRSPRSDAATVMSLAVQSGKRSVHTGVAAAAAELRPKTVKPAPILNASLSVTQCCRPPRWIAARELKLACN